MQPHSHLSPLYRPGFGLATDLYQLTMAYGYWRQGLHRRRAVFHLFYRRPPFGGQYVVAAGLALAVDLLQHFRFEVDDIQYLGSLRGADGQAMFPEAFLHFLQRFRFSGHVSAVPEGTVVFPHEPMLRIEAPLVEAQLVETALLTLLNFSSLVATKAARMVAAAGGGEVLEFGMRRAQGLDGALTASRAAYLGGCHATSNLWAGRYYGIPVRGTHAHSWVMAFDDEPSAFAAYAAAMPNNGLFLVDTYDTLQGVRHAIEVGHHLRARGQRLLGIRLDSGNLAELSQQARRLLDEAGFADATIVASDDLDEHRIAELRAAGAPIGVWGVGTRLATAYDQPALGGVYKLAAIESAEGQWQYRLKHSETALKTSVPGCLQVRRYSDAQGQPVSQVVYDEWQGPPPAARWVAWTDGARHEATGAVEHDLLQSILHDGKLVYTFPSLNASRAHALAECRRFSQVDWSVFSTGLEPGLHRIREDLRQQTKTP